MVIEFLAYITKKKKKKSIKYKYLDLPSYNNQDNLKNR